MKGRRFKSVDDPSGLEDILDGLADMGIKDEKHRKSVVQSIEKMVKKSEKNLLCWMLRKLKI